MRKIFLTILTLAILFSAVQTFAFGGWLKEWKYPWSLDSASEAIQRVFEIWAKILGISVEKVKNYWAEGKTLKEIMEAEGIDKSKVKERKKELRLEQIKSFLQTLVDKGIITQEQMEKRLEFEKNRLNEGKGWGFGRGGKHFWFGFPGPKW